MLDYGILGVSVVLAIVFSFFMKYFKGVFILVPVNYDNPLPEGIGDPVYYRFGNYGEIKDRSTYKPKILLASVIFSLCVIILKIFVTPNDNWDFIIFSSAGIITLSFLFITLRSTLLFAIFTAVPPVVLDWFGVTDWFWLSLSAGFLPGMRAGMILATSYHNLILHSQKKSEKIQEEGRKVQKCFRSFYKGMLRAVPFMILYQTASYFWPSINIGKIAAKTNSSFLFYLLTIFGLFISVNIAWYILSLFRETLIISNIEGAASFTTKLRELEKEAESEGKTPFELLKADREGRKFNIKNIITFVIDHYFKTSMYAKNQDINDFLGKKWQWIAFQSEQIMGLLFVTLILLFRIFGEVLSLTTTTQISTFSGQYAMRITQFINIAASITLWANIMFLIVMLPVWLSDKDDEKSLNERNMEKAWRGFYDNTLEFTCMEIKTEATLQVVGEEEEKNQEEEGEQDVQEE